jgi:hypothetical protein
MEIERERSTDQDIGNGLIQEIEQWLTESTLTVNYSMGEEVGKELFGLPGHDESKDH